MSLNLAGFDLRKIQDIVDQRQQVFSRGPNLLQIFNKFCVPAFRDLFLQHFTVPNNGVQWSAKFVAHVGEKCALGAACLFSQFLCNTEAFAAFRNTHFQSRVQLSHFGGVFFLLRQTVEVDPMRIIRECQHRSDGGKNCELKY